MLVQDETIQTLMEIGLTGLQAKVYLALTQMEKANGKTLWKLSGAARQDIYRILDELHNKGLIEKILTIPTQYKAIPIQEGLSILLKRKVEQCKEVEAKIDNLLQKFQTNNEKNTFAPQQFVLIPAKEAHERRINQTFRNLEKSIDSITIVKCNNKAKAQPPKLETIGQKPLHISAFLPPLLKKAIIRGVNCRHLLNVPYNEKRADPVVWKTKGVYELRFIHDLPPIMFCIVDDKEVFFATDPASNPYDSDALWTNNPALVKIARTYFEMQWENAVKDKQ